MPGNFCEKPVAAEVLHVIAETATIGVRSTFGAEVGYRSDPNDTMRMIAKDICTIRRQICSLDQAYREVALAGFSHRMLVAVISLLTGKQPPYTELTEGTTWTASSCRCSICGAFEHGGTVIENVTSPTRCCPDDIDDQKRPCRRYRTLRASTASVRSAEA